MNFPIGTSVRVHSPGYSSTHQRTGVVIAVGLKFPWRDSVDLQLDPVPGQPALIKVARVPMKELRVIKTSDRPASALPREQLGLFGEAA